MLSYVFNRKKCSVCFSIFIICPVLFFLVGYFSELISDDDTKISSNYSKLVYPGSDGRLVYTPDEKGNIIPDFSHAGYRGGG